MHRWIIVTPARHACLLAVALLVGILDSPLRGSPLDQWMPRLSPTTPNHLYGVSYSHGRFVAVGFASFLSSTDGSEWTPGSFTEGQSGVGYAVVAGPDRFVAPGRWASISSTSNGLIWVTQRAPTNVYSLTGVAYGNGDYVIVGDAVLTSSNAINWTVQPMTNPPASVTFLNGSFYASGSQQTIMRSTNGVSWIRQSFSPNGWVTGIAYGRGNYVAVGDEWNPVAGASDAAILTSTNGIDWRRNPFFLRRELRSVAYGAGYFVAVGQLGTILTSPDGQAWTSRNSGTSSYLRHVFYGNATFLVVGENGTILQSDPLVSLELTTKPETRLTVNGPLNRSCRIEYADALVSGNQWQELATVVLTNPAVTCVDSGTTNAAHRHYRAVLLP